MDKVGRHNDAVIESRQELDSELSPYLEGECIPKDKLGLGDVWEREGRLMNICFIMKGKILELA